RNKIGGHVASKNRAGAYLRTKVTPVNRQTVDQNTVRNRFTIYSQGWRGLTQAQRDAWNAAVGDYATTDIFGDLKNPTGFNLYQRLNNNLVTVGATAILTPPIPASVGEVVAMSLTAEDNTVAEALSLTLAGPVPAGTAVKVFATPAISSGKSYVKNTYRLIDTLDAAAGASVDLLSAYQAKYGSISQSGMKIFVKVVAVNTSTGQEGTPSEVSAIIAASA
ncbi:MAG: hypothetical protein SVR94_03005, partial [Pseudomonadota bacterium]|nr:hypothetical protein [Pseudomonadota bacterium]